MRTWLRLVKTRLLKISTLKKSIWFWEGVTWIWKSCSSRVNISKRPKLNRSCMISCVRSNICTPQISSTEIWNLEIFWWTTTVRYRCAILAWLAPWKAFICKKKWCQLRNRDQATIWSLTDLFRPSLAFWAQNRLQIQECASKSKSRAQILRPTFKVQMVPNLQAFPV